MSEKRPTKSRVQQTQPKKGKPVEIPVPTRDEVLRDLAKLAKPSAGGAEK